MADSHSIALAAPAAGPRVPWMQRLAATPPWTPWRLAAAIAAVLFAAFFAVEWITGRLEIVFGPDVGAHAETARVNFRITLVMIPLFAYLPAAFADGARSARRATADLAPHLRASPGETAAIVEQAGRFDPVALRRAGWIGVFFAVLIPIWIDRQLEAWVIWRHASEAIAQRVLLPPVGWFAARFIYSLWAESRRLSQIGRSLVAVDLLDARRFAPLTRQGLRYALLTIGVLSILAFYLFDYAKKGLFAVVLLAGAIALVAAASALLLPLRGARDAIAAAKRAELDWCDAELRR
ncbi:MAG: hypothetical protein DCC71_20220, partial [Proteobacteria bacterium]